MKQDENLSKHEQQKLFLEEYMSNLGRDLKDMNQRRGQSLNSELDLSRVHNSSLVMKESNADNMMKSSIIQKPSYQIRLNNDSSHNQIIENNLDLTNQLVTLNERNITANSAQNIQESKCKESDYLQNNYNKKVSNQSSHKGINNSEQKKEMVKVQQKKQKKSVLGQFMLNNQNLSNMSLIPKILKKLNYFYQTFTKTGRLKFLQNSQVRKQIEDLSEYDQIKTSFLSQISKITIKFLEFYEKTLMKDMPLIDTYGNINFCLLMFYSLYNALFFYFLSVVIVFQGPTFYINYVFYVTGSLWILESFLKINTKIYKPFKPEYKRKKILITYFKKRSFFDIIPITIVFYLTSLLQDESHYFKLLLFLKIKNIISDVHDVQKQLCMMFKNYFFIKLVNLILQLFLIGHILAISWYLLGVVEVKYFQEETTWYNEGISSDLVWWKLYLAAVYWSLTLMTTGSNVANTVTQMSFTCLTMLFTTIVFGYLINVIGIILSELDKQNETKNRDINLVNEYMRLKNISRQFFQQKIHQLINLQIN